MALNFPNAPAVGDTHEGYAWDGEKWIVGSASSVPAPDWVPAGASIFIDFMNSRAWDGAQVLDAVGIGQLLGNDPTSDLWMGGSYYSPDLIGPDGYDYGDDPNARGYAPAAIGKFKEMLREGVTIVTTHAFAQYSSLYASLSSLSGESATELYSYQDMIGLFSYSNQNNIIPRALDYHPTDASLYAPNRIAYTVTEATSEESGRMEIAANGGVAQAQILGLSDFPEGPPEAMYLDGVPIQSIAVYPPQPLETLSDLSDMGFPAEVHSFQPTTATVNMNFTLSIEGNYFEPDDIIQIDGADIETLFIGRKQVMGANVITAPAAVGSMVVTLSTAADGVIDVGTIAVTDAPQVPIVTDISPAEYITNSVNNTVEVTGEYLRDTFVIYMRNTPLETVFNSAESLTGLGFNAPALPETMPVELSEGGITQTTTQYVEIVDPPVAVPAPDWAPAGSIACVDFMGGTPQGRGFDGFGEYDAAGMAVMLGNDYDADLYYSGSFYDPLAIVETGYDYYSVGGSGTGPAAIGTLKTMMINPEGLTFVLGYNLCEGNNNIWTFLNSSDGNAFWVYLSSLGNVTVGNDVRDFFDLGPADIWTTDFEGRLPNRIAVTLTPTLCEVSMNGDPVQSLVLDATDWPDGPPIGFLWDGGDLMCLEVYPVRPATDLPLLSALPVTAARMISASPDQAVVGGPNVNLTVDGENFTEARYAVRVDGTQLSTAMASSTQLMAAVPSSAVAKTSIITVVDTTTSTEIPGSDTLEFYESGGVPDWVPDGALIHIDFLNGGRAWDGTTELDAAGIGTLLGADAAVSGTVAFNPAWIETHGLNPPNYETFAFLGAANAALFPAGSLVARWRHDATLTSRPEITLYADDISKTMRFYHPGAVWEMYGTGSTLSGEDGPIDHSANLAPNAAGLTHSGTGDGANILISANNAAQVTIPVGEANIPAASPMTKGKISSSHITSLTFYEALADLAPLTTPDPPANPNILPLPLITIDFLNDTATNAGATVGIASLLGSDAIAQNSGMPNSYNAALNLSPNGYTTGSDATWCGFIGPAKTAMTEGATIVYRILVESMGLELQNITHGYYSNNAAARSLKAIVDQATTTMKLHGDDGVLWADESEAGAISVVVGEVNTFALQLIHTPNNFDSTMWVSVNGQPAFGSALPQTSAPWSFAYTLFASGKNRVQSIDIYKNVGIAPSMLPALSAPLQRAIDGKRSAGKRRQSRRFANAKARMVRALKEEK